MCEILCKIIHSYVWLEPSDWFKIYYKICDNAFVVINFNLHAGCGEMKIA